MTIIYTKNSLDWVISRGIHIKSDKLARNGWEWHILAIIMVLARIEEQHILKKRTIVTIITVQNDYI